MFKEKGSTGEPQQIACGQCIGCRLERSRVWAVRIANEASLYQNNCFITLTYAPEHLPANGSLVLEHFQLFLKRLRKKYGSNIRFFHCGEYGESLGRPHYHACLLNFDFPDKRHTRVTPRGDLAYESKSLSMLWPFGRHEIGELTFESAAYCARYVTKKVTGNAADAHYSRVDFETGEIISLKPEYTTMSRRPGIGAPFLQRFAKDVYSGDCVVLKGGAKIPPPKFYDKHYELINPDHYHKVKVARECRDINIMGTDDFKRRAIDNTPDRLKVREVVQKATLSATLNRNYEK